MPTKALKAPDMRDNWATAPDEIGPDQSTNCGDEGPSGAKLAVDYRPLEALIPYARNARTHSDKQVAEIAASIRAFGWTNPILVDGDNGVMPVMGGCWRRGNWA